MHKTPEEYNCSSFGEIQALFMFLVNTNFNAILEFLIDIFFSFLFFF